MRRCLGDSLEEIKSQIPMGPFNNQFCYYFFGRCVELQCDDGKTKALAGYAIRFIW